MPGLGLGIGIGLNTNFTGLHLKNSLHEWYTPNTSIIGSTMTLFDTGSVGGVLLNNPTAAQLPTYSTIGSRKAVLMDGVDDELSSTLSNFRSTDHSGVMHFVIKTPSILTVPIPIFSNNKLSSGILDRLYFAISGLNKLIMIVNNAGTNTQVNGISTFAANTKYLFSVFCDGTNLKVYKGLTQEINTIGTGGIIWFGDIMATTNFLSLFSFSGFYQKNIGGFGVYTPYTSDADVFADQKIIAKHFGIIV